MPSKPAVLVHKHWHKGCLQVGGSTPAWTFLLTFDQLSCPRSQLLQPMMQGKYTYQLSHILWRWIQHGHSQHSTAPPSPTKRPTQAKQNTMFQSRNSINRGIHHSRTHDTFHQTSYIALPPKILLRSPLAMEHWKGNRPPSFAVPRRPQRLKVAVKQCSPICSNAFSPRGRGKSRLEVVHNRALPSQIIRYCHIITFKLALSTMSLSSNAWLMQVEEVCSQLLPLAFACETRLPKQSLECPHHCERESQLFACFSKPSLPDLAVVCLKPEDAVFFPLDRG